MFLKRKAYFFLIGIFCFYIQVITSQDQRVSDSLAVIYKLDTLGGEAKLDLLYSLSFNEINDFDLALEYAEELIQLSLQSNNYEYLSYGYFQKGNAKQFIGNLQEALAAYFESAEVSRRENLIPVEGSSYAAIADISAVSGNYNNAMHYYNKAIATLRKI